MFIKKIVKLIASVMVPVALVLSISACSDKDKKTPEKQQKTQIKDQKVTLAVKTYTTESGLKYQILRAGTGSRPTADDNVTVQYKGTLMDGTKFDSSYDRRKPETFPLNRVIKGWAEGLKLMKVGAKYKFIIPAKLAYGKKAVGPIPPNSDLIFTVELLKIAIDKGRLFLEKNKDKPGIKTTASGLQYEILRKGTGKHPKATDRVTVNYEGTLIDGTKFDSSYDRKKPIDFGLNQVIRGWTEGVQLMKEGAKYKFFIPSYLAYGPQGSPGTIPPDATLIFTVELIRVN